MRILFLLVSALAAAGAAAAGPSPSGAVSPSVEAVLKAMDRTADPCTDFYRYACGGWLDSTPLPADQARWGRGFSEIAERNRLVLKDILESAAKDPGGDPERRKLGTYYAACMDEAAVEQAGTAPLKPWLDEIAKVTDAKSLWPVAGRLDAHGMGAFFGGHVEPDYRDPEKEILHVSQGGLGLPDRDYYLEASYADKLSAYREHVGRMLALTGVPAGDAGTLAAAIVEFETGLARVSRPKAELRDPDKTYHKLDVDGLQKLTPALSWKAYLSAAGHPGIKDVNVATPDFFKGMDALIASTDPAVLRAYLRWHAARQTSGRLPDAFVRESFDFYGKTLAGQKEIKARWKRCSDATTAAMGEALGKQYIERMFAGDSKKIALEMIKDVEASFEANLGGLAWMDDATRARARDKMKAIVNKIGYPDTWRDYGRLEVKPGRYFENGLAADRFEFDRNLSKVGKPKDRGEWYMTPPEVNAYYNPLNNEMAFPAGILQPPFFHKDQPAAMNYGGMGMVMGHELTHGFDDQGRKFDPKGRLVEWWSPEVSTKFDAAAQCVDALYSGFEVLPGVKLNGKLTLGENIADLGGIKQAHAAYNAWVGRHGDPGVQVPGLTDDQLFFVGFAQTWCTQASPEILRMLATVDPHSDPRSRVNGPLSQFPTFAQTFSCPAGAPMRPAEVCTVW